MKADKLLFGAAYYDEYLPCDRIETDMEMMEKAHINVIRIAESTWSTWEPQDNVFDFSHLHRMLKASEKHGIQVIVGTPTYAVHYPCALQRIRDSHRCAARLCGTGRPFILYL